MNRYFRVWALKAAAVVVCLFGFVLGAQAQNRQALPKRPQPPHGRMKPGKWADPRRQMLARDSVAKAEQKSVSRPPIPPHLQNLPPQLLAKMPWLQPDQAKRPDLQRGFHPLSKFNRPWEQQQNLRMKPSQPLSKSTASSAAQIMSGCLTEDWAARYNDPGTASDFARDVVVDDDGNVYVTGYTNVSSSFDYLTTKYDAAGVLQWKTLHNGPGNYDDTAIAIAVDGSGNIYVTGTSFNSDFTTDYATIKYNAAGVQQWEARYNGPENSNDVATALALDGSGNVYVTGYSYNLNGYSDYATLKYDATGVQQWEARYDGPANLEDFAFALAVDGSSNAYVTGYSNNSDGNYDYATVKYDATGAQQWDAQYDGGVNGFDTATALAVDGSGNVYVIGNSQNSNGDDDFLTIKYDAAGEEEWEARFDGPVNDSERATALAVDGSGNVYVTGRSRSSTDYDYTTLKYDPDGAQLWEARYNGPGNDGDVPLDFAVDGSGNVYVTGYSENANGDDDYATIKYNTAGGQLWEARYNGPVEDDEAHALALDASGNVYVTGQSEDIENDFATVKYDGATGSELWSVRHNEPEQSNDVAHAMAVDAAGNSYVTGSTYGSDLNFDYLTVKYNAAGILQWAMRYNGPGNSTDEAFALAVDASGNIYVTGSSYGSDGYPDYATVKYDANGVQQWEARYNGPDNLWDSAYALTLDGGGNVYVTGTSNNSAGYSDYTTVKYDANGVQQWEALYDGPDNYYDQATAIAVDGSGNVYVTGYSYNSADGYSDYATLKYDNDGAQQWEARYDGPDNRYEFTSALAVDGSGNIYVTGSSYNAADIPEYATIKYNSAGVQQWEARYNGSGNGYNFATALAVHGSGSIYVTGSSVNSNDNPDYATLKYNTAGVLQWEARYDGSENHDAAYALAVDQCGNVYVTGTSYNNSEGYPDYATVKYNTAGVQQCETRYSGPENHEDTPIDIFVDGSGNVYVAGTSYDPDYYGDYATVKYSGGSGLTANAGADLARATGVSPKIGANPTASGGTTPLTYLWSPATGLSSASVANPTATPTSTTTYMLTVTDANGNTCTDYVTVRAGNLVNSRIKLIIGPTNVYDPVLNQVRVDMGVKNVSNAPIYGPLSAVFKTLNPGPPKVTIGNADGGGEGLGSYYDYSNLMGPDNVLSPGETTSFKLWIFQEHVIPAVNFKFFADIVGDLDGVPKVAADDQPLAFSFDLQKAAVQDDSDAKATGSDSEIPVTYALHQNHPNPFNPSTTMQFDLPEAGEVSVKIYNSVGQLVRTLVSGDYEAGVHKAIWDARDDGGVQMASGVYLAVFKAGEVKQVRRVVLMK